MSYQAIKGRERTLKGYCEVLKSPSEKIMYSVTPTSGPSGKDKVKTLEDHWLSGVWREG